MGEKGDANICCRLVIEREIDIKCFASILTQKMLITRVDDG